MSTGDHPRRVFLLSPANCGGVRGKMVMSKVAEFDLARRLQSAEGAPLGEVFSFVSGLYFRGKLAYARRFASPPDPADPITAGGVLVITPNAGLRSADMRITQASLRAFAATDIHATNEAYCLPLELGVRTLVDAVGPDCEVVLLGSIASDKYAQVLLPLLGDRLRFPSAFVGRGDMSRGGLLLRCAASGDELDYVPIAGAIRRGRRPPKLTLQSTPKAQTPSFQGTQRRTPRA